MSRSLLLQRLALTSLVVLALVSLAFVAIAPAFVAPRLVPPGLVLAVAKIAALAFVFVRVRAANTYSMQWSSMFILLFIAEGTVRAGSDPQPSASLGIVETLAAAIYFAAVLAMLRPLKRAARKNGAASRSASHAPDSAPHIARNSASHTAPDSASHPASDTASDPAPHAAPRATPEAASGAVSDQPARP